MSIVNTSNTYFVMHWSVWFIREYLVNVCIQYLCKIMNNNCHTWFSFASFSGIKFSCALKALFMNYNFRGEWFFVYLVLFIMNHSLFMTLFSRRLFSRLALCLMNCTVERLFVKSYSCYELYFRIMNAFSCYVSVDTCLKWWNHTQYVFINCSFSRLVLFH